MIIDGYCTLGVDREYDLDGDGLLAAMDQAEVEWALIAPVERRLVVDIDQGNDFLMRAATEHPDRFLPCCAANPWEGERALEGLRRAVGQGARMLVVHPAVQGFQANDELIQPLLEAVAGMHVPVYVHTGPPGSATPWQVVDLADSFPEVDFIIGHSGATDFWNDAAEAGKARQNVYLESSLARPFTFARHVEEAGYAKGIMGSGAPLNDLVFEWEQMRRALPAGARTAVFGGNMARLLSKRGPL